MKPRNSEWSLCSGLLTSEMGRVSDLGYDSMLALLSIE
jgi:hypothetical protein